MNFLEGIEFNVMQPIGVNVVAFAIKMTKAEQWKNLPLCTLEKLEYTETAVNGRVQRTFSIPYSGEMNDTNVLIASLAKNRCVIGYGHVENNVFVSEEETIQLEYTSYGESDIEARNYSFTYNPQRQIVLLDADTGNQIIPNISTPDMFGNLKGTYKLIPYKNYIALEMNVRIKLTNQIDTKDMNIDEWANVML